MIRQAYNSLSAWDDHGSNGYRWLLILLEGAVEKRCSLIAGADSTVALLFGVSVLTGESTFGIGLWNGKMAAMVWERLACGSSRRVVMLHVSRRLEAAHLAVGCTRGGSTRDGQYNCRQQAR